MKGRDFLLNRKSSLNAVFGLIVAAILVVSFFALKGLGDNTTPSSADIRSLIESQKVDTVVVKDRTLTMTLKEPWRDQTTVTAKLYSAELFYEEFNDVPASSTIMITFPTPPCPGGWIWCRGCSSSPCSGCCFT